MWYVVVGVITGIICTVCMAIRLFVIDHKVQWMNKEIELNLHSSKGILLAIVNMVACFIIEGAIWPVEIPAKIYEILRYYRCRRKYGPFADLAYEMGYK